MKVHLIRKETIRHYTMRNARTKISFEEWMDKVRFADWNYPADIRRTFNSADFLGEGSNRIVFTIAGNNNRMICKYAFGKKQVHLFVCWIGTHADYEKVCQGRQQYTITNY